MDFSIYERFTDYREEKAAKACLEETADASIRRLFEEAEMWVEQNVEVFDRLLERFAGEEPLLCSHALEYFEDVRDRCDRLARMHRGRLCAKIDRFTYRATVSLYVPFLSLASFDLLEIAQRTEGVAMTACRDSDEVLLLFSVPFFASGASPFDRALGAFSV